MHVHGRRRPRPVDPTARRAVAAVAALTAALLGTGAVGAPASAHTDLVATAPSDGARLDAAPREVSLDFTDEMSPDLSAVTLTVGADQPRELVVTGGGQPTRLVAAIPAAGDLGAPPAGGPQTWIVGYRVVSADGHPVAGQLRFRVQSTPEGPAAAGAEKGGGEKVAGSETRTGDDDPGAGAAPTSDLAAEQTSSSTPLLAGAVAGGALLLLGGSAVVRLTRRGGRSR